MSRVQGKEEILGKLSVHNFEREALIKLHLEYIKRLLHHRASDVKIIEPNTGGPCLTLAWFALHLAQVLFTLARDLFNFGLVALHLAQDLFTLARALFNFGLVCLAFSPGFVYFG